MNSSKVSSPWSLRRGIEVLKLLAWRATVERAIRGAGRAAARAKEPRAATRRKDMMFGCRCSLEKREDGTDREVVMRQLVVFEVSAFLGSGDDCRVVWVEENRLRIWGD